MDTSHIEGWPKDVVLGVTEITKSEDIGILSENELEEFNSFTNPSRKAEYLSARSLFRFLLAELKLADEGIELLKEEGGKPFARNLDEMIHVSFSHSPKKVFCAISKKKEVGLDVELSNRKINQAVAARILNEHELDEVGKENPVQLWTIKEAAVKCLGTGLRTNLSDLTIQKNKKNRFSVRFNNEKLFEICSFRQSDHQIALAYQSKHI